MSDYPEIAERFARDTRWHKMTILHDDGLYRHLRCQSRKHGMYWFDIVTWPGSLAIRGDLNAAYVFSRTSDMFGLFRIRTDGINPGYWSEKLPEGRRSVETYSPDLLRWNIRQALRDEYEDLLTGLLADTAKQYGLDVEHLRPELAKPCHTQARDYMRKLRAAINEHLFDPWSPYIVEYEDSALTGIDDFTFVSDEGRKFEFDGWQEWDVRDYDWSFLWACHAIVWGIQQYDAAKAAEKAQTVPAGGAA
jgi:hypothetical protein